MRRQIPWRKLKVAVFILVAALIAHSLWMMTGIYKTAPPQNGDYILKAHGHILPHFEKVKVVRTKNVCHKIKPWTGKLSTFDLPAETDYTLDANGRYKIPPEFYDADENTATRDDKVNVVLVPFSHADPGYGMTFEGYYTQRFSQVFRNMVSFLTENRNMTFQWAEVVFLERWFRDIPDTTKQQVRELIRRGQLEVVLGGWVMPDEAVTHYQIVIDQLIEGHQWIEENLGIKPVNAWINDPFGYSSTMPYLWKKSGIENMVILRIHQAIKATLMRKRAMDFMWRPYWSSDDANDILTNLMPYPGYWNGDVCGPDQNVCKQFNFLHMMTSSEAVPVTDANVKDLAEKLYKAYRFTSRLYGYDNLVIFIGEDASYDLANAFRDTHSNYGKIMQYINAKSDWKMNIKFGTVKDYFESIRKVESKLRNTKSPDKSFPVLSGDFFPYSDFENDTWTGYFTTRIWMKRFTREIEPLIRAADMFSVSAFHQCTKFKAGCAEISKAYKDIMGKLRNARRDVGMFQHHDGITGTSLPFVVSDYEERLTNAFRQAREALASTLSLLLTNGSISSTTALKNSVNKDSPRSLLLLNELKFQGEQLKIVVANPVEHAREDVVSVCIAQGHVVVTEEEGNTKQYQASESTHPTHSGLSILSFPVKLLPYEVRTFTISRTATSPKHAVESSVLIFDEKSKSSTKYISIENDFIEVQFDSRSGSLESINDKKTGKSTVVRSKFYKYIPGKSGAYLFEPNGPAQEINILYDSTPNIKVTSGMVFSEVSLTYKSGFSQKFTIYNVDDVKATSVFITNEIDLNIEPSLVNTEIIMRLQTDVDNEDLFFTDQNGFTLMGRRNNRQRPIETNYYPMTTMAILEDKGKRLTLHSAQPHGVAALEDGWLEVMLDRNVFRDDRKGLGQGVTERVLTRTEFAIQVEYKEATGPVVEPRFTHATLNSIVVNEHLQNKLLTFSLEQTAETFSPKLQIVQLKSFPCDLTFAGLRQLVSNDLESRGTSLVLHRKSPHCGFPVGKVLCSMSSEKVLLSDYIRALGVNQSVFNVTETSLSHLHHVKSLTFNDDIAPTYGELRSFLIQSKH
ncbi:alpha-mannosidase 2-like isoform X3 [Dreissena polymorpha]|uniref:Alpha-mannosidase n=2 Tax=Dreissena polymorpha TaxID=45954 RepID=A0A9D4JK88_DREPO|nr:alpha-mannosidase 2-like isoform X3 [Dreissena polymorpha]XP_052216567.1 alpha-mannosidase 2-like isoform X3 [Dreissena polymorpha]XP_052216568.1 alpha-mannosidase 2-like isoform X3 [Dreissena polymorpha]XP_052216569.1 alpha-mannosidase 2-like isoform X3 [Dreissena polymorpha]XP_052216570.1 alpha-mannosidase 2-like isoform X3 [Dreissena polymorpha]XP_052216571.1 alpha-mannosidase 2-like isoform X3 [Dreissena polymorpha]XP_052216573.1 alpha-mannosidase 2-like isoform X3 [Dreissena polymorph